MSGGVNPFSRSRVSKIQKRLLPSKAESGRNTLVWFHALYSPQRRSETYLQRIFTAADIVHFAIKKKKGKKSFVVKSSIRKEENWRESG